MYQTIIKYTILDYSVSLLGLYYFYWLACFVNSASKINGNTSRLDTGFTRETNVSLTPVLHIITTHVDYSVYARTLTTITRLISQIRKTTTMYDQPFTRSPVVE